MSTKDCPSCGATVPLSATRCKECFHDFTEEPISSSSSGPILLLGTVAAMCVVGAIAFWYIASQPLDRRILVDEGTQSVIWTEKYRGDQVKTERLPFNDIAHIEYVLRSTGGFEVVAVTTTNERRVIEEDSRPLRTEANRYAELMEKELREVDNTRGFHTLSDD